MFTWDPCAVNPGTFNHVSKVAYELRIVLLLAFIACMLWLLRQRRLQQRRMLEIQRLRSAMRENGRFIVWGGNDVGGSGCHTPSSWYLGT